MHRACSPAAHDGEAEAEREAQQCAAAVGPPLSDCAR
jgi:hypothetical protein